MLNELTGKNGDLPVMLKPKLWFFWANKQCRFSWNSFYSKPVKKWNITIYAGYAAYRNYRKKQCRLQYLL